MTNVISNPWAAAADATEAIYSSDVFGQIEFDIWFCILQKGVGKVPFDPATHPIAQRRTAVDVSLTDISGLNYTRSFIAEIGTDGWLKVTLPSLKAVGASDLQQFNGRYVHAVMEGFGKYTNADGEERTRTAPKIVRVFASREECEAAAAAGSTSGPDWLVNPQPAAPGPAANGQPAAADAGNPERQVALQFLPAIVKTCVSGNGIDSAKLDAALKSNPILNKYFNLGSPEVALAMSQALAEPAF